MFRHFKKLYFDVYFTARFFFSFDKSCEHEQCISSSNPEGRCKSTQLLTAFLMYVLLRYKLLYLLFNKLSQDAAFTFESKFKSKKGKAEVAGC